MGGGAHTGGGVCLAVQQLGWGSLCACGNLGGAQFTGLEQNKDRYEHVVHDVMDLNNVQCPITANWLRLNNVKQTQIHTKAQRRGPIYWIVLNVSKSWSCGHRWRWSKVSWRSYYVPTWVTCWPCLFSECCPCLQAPCVCWCCSGNAGRWRRFCVPQWSWWGRWSSSGHTGRSSPEWIPPPDQSHPEWSLLRSVDFPPGWTLKHWRHTFSLIHTNIIRNCFNFLTKQKVSILGL